MSTENGTRIKASSTGLVVEVVILRTHLEHIQALLRAAEVYYTVEGEVESGMWELLQDEARRAGGCLEAILPAASREEMPF